MPDTSQNKSNQINKLIAHAKKLDDAGKHTAAREIHEDILGKLHNTTNSNLYRQASIAYTANIFAQGYYLRTIELAKKNLELEVNDLRQAAEQDHRLFILIAQSYEKLGHCRSALAYIEKALKLCTNYALLSPIFTPSVCLLLLVKLALKVDDLALAAKHLSRLVSPIMSDARATAGETLLSLLRTMTTKQLDAQLFTEALPYLRLEVKLLKRSFDTSKYQTTQRLCQAINRLAFACEALQKKKTAKRLYRTHIKLAALHLETQHAALRDSILKYFDEEFL